MTVMLDRQISYGHYNYVNARQKYYFTDRLLSGSFPSFSDSHDIDAQNDWLKELTPKHFTWNYE